MKRWYPSIWIIFFLFILPVVCFAGGKLQIEEPSFDFNSHTSNNSLDTYTGYIVYNDNSREIPLIAEVKFTDYYNFSSVLDVTTSDDNGYFSFEDFDASMSFNVLCRKDGFYTAYKSRYAFSWSSEPEYVRTKIYLQPEDGSINATGKWIGLFKSEGSRVSLAYINLKQSGTEITGRIKEKLGRIIKGRGTIKGSINKNVLTFTIKITINGCKNTLKCTGIIEYNEKDTMVFSFQGKDCNNNNIDNNKFRENLMYFNRKQRQASK